MRICMCLPCCSNSEKTQWTATAAIAISSIVLLVLNCLAVNGGLSSVSIGVVNTLVFSAVAIPAIIGLIKNFDNLDCKERTALLAAFIFFGTLAALSSLGIAKVFSAASVGWTFLAPLISVIGIAVIGAAVHCYLQNKNSESEPLDLWAKFF